MTDQLLLRIADLPTPARWLFRSRSTASSSAAKQARVRPSAALSTAEDRRLEWRVLIIPTEAISEPLDYSRRVHEAVKERFRQRNPSLRTQLAHEEVVKLMDDLSKKVARRKRFATWQEAMAFMRGEDHHDLERQ